MKLWIIIFVFHGESTAHALGYFPSKAACWQWVEKTARHSMRYWIGRCMTSEEFEEEYPDLWIDNLET